MARLCESQGPAQANVWCPRFFLFSVGMELQLPSAWQRRGQNGQNGTSTDGTMSRRMYVAASKDAM